MATAAMPLLAGGSLKQFAFGVERLPRAPPVHSARRMPDAERAGGAEERSFARCLAHPRKSGHFPFTLSVIGTLSIRLRDLTMSFVVSAYFLKCGVSRWALKASAFS
jgi:hypothetical protein